VEDGGNKIHSAERVYVSSLNFLSLNLICSVLAYIRCYVAYIVYVFQKPLLMIYSDNTVLPSICFQQSVTG
jgi:hypothetical protein